MARYRRSTTTTTSIIQGLPSNFDTVQEVAKFVSEGVYFDADIEGLNLILRRPDNTEDVIDLAPIAAGDVDIQTITSGSIDGYTLNLYMTGNESVSIDLSPLNFLVTPSIDGTDLKFIDSLGGEVIIDLSSFNQSAQITSLETRIETNETNITSIINNVDGLLSQTIPLDVSDLTDNGGLLIHPEYDDISINTRVSNIESSLSEVPSFDSTVLVNTDSSLETRLSTLESIHDADDTTMSSSVAGLSTLLSTFEGTISIQQSVIASLEAKVDSYHTSEDTPSVTPTPSPTVTASMTGTPVATPTPSVSNTPDVTSTPMVTSTPTVTKTPTVTRTATNTPTASVTPSLTNTPTPSASGVISETPTPTSTPTVTNTPTVTRTATNTPTPSPTPSVTKTPTVTRTATNTPTASVTPSVTKTPTVTRTATNTPTPSVSGTPSVTPTPSVSGMPSVTPTPSSSASAPQTLSSYLLYADSGAQAGDVLLNPNNNQYYPFISAGAPSTFELFVADRLNNSDRISILTHDVCADKATFTYNLSFEGKTTSSNQVQAFFMHPVAQGTVDQIIDINTNLIYDVTPDGGQLIEVDNNDYRLYRFLQPQPDGTTFQIKVNTCL